MSVTHTRTSKAHQPVVAETTDWKNELFKALAWQLDSIGVIDLADPRIEEIFWSNFGEGEYRWRTTQGRGDAESMDLVDSLLDSFYVFFGRRIRAKSTVRWLDRNKELLPSEHSTAWSARLDEHYNISGMVSAIGYDSGASMTNVAKSIAREYAELFDAYRLPHV